MMKSKELKLTEQEKAVLKIGVLYVGQKHPELSKEMLDRLYDKLRTLVVE